MRSHTKSFHLQGAQRGRKLWAAFLIVLTIPMVPARSSDSFSAGQDAGSGLTNDACGITSSKHRLENIGQEFIYNKTVDCNSGTIYAVVTDSDGKEIDLQAAFLADLKARQANPATKIHPDLRAAFAKRPNKRVSVLVWLTADAAPLDDFAFGFLDPLAPEMGVPPKFDEQIVLDIENELLAFNRGYISQLTQRFAKFLGKRVNFIGDYAPVVATRANEKEVLKMAEIPAVDTIYLEGDSGELNREALFAHRVLPDWTNTGFGADRKVAVLEKDPIEDGLFIDVEDFFRPGARVDTGHAQKVAGVIQSRLLTRLGTAPIARLLSANTGSIRDTPVTEGMGWALDRRVDITNLSWGGPLVGSGRNTRFAPDGEMHYLDRYFDYLARYNWQSFVAAAGNLSRDFVHSPASAWNVIAVGNIITGPDPDPDPLDWNNDRMNPKSSYVNPLNGNMKPNVVARGTNIRTLGIARNSYIPIPDPDSGTSLAAPYVTATLALAMNRNPTLLASPEAAMATIMASAWNNVDGPADRPISNLDGAGGIHTSAATRLAGNFRTIYTYINPTAVEDRGYKAIPVELTAGERTRIAVSWFADPAFHVHEIGYLQTDIDLLVFEGPPDSTGLIRGFSVSDFNNTELIDFVPQQSGTHTLAIFAPRLIGARNDRVGIAVSRYNTDTAE